MPTITLTTDFGNDNFYLGVLRGYFAANCPEANVIELTHHIQAFNIAQAAFVLKNAFRFFPEGSIHLVAVYAEETESSPYIVMKYDNHFFIGADNGIFGLICEGAAQSVVKIDPEKLVSNGQLSFPELSVLAPAACKLVKEKATTALGDYMTTVQKRIGLMPTYTEDQIIGSVIYIDTYSNVFTNINRELFERIRKGRKFTIYVNSKHNQVQRISQTYSDVPVGDLVALFNSVNLLEIAIHKGPAAQLFNLDTKSTIRVNFENKL